MKLNLRVSRLIDFRLYKCMYVYWEIIGLEQNPVYNLKLAVHLTPLHVFVSNGVIVS